MSAELRRSASCCSRQTGRGLEFSHLLSGVAATGDDGNTANLEELHFGVGRVVNGGMKGGWLLVVDKGILTVDASGRENSAVVGFWRQDLVVP
jgi:hypothetical protein